MAIRRIGQIFVDMGFISDEQLDMLLEEQQQRPGTLLGKIALELNLLTEEQLMQALAEQMGMQVVELGDIVDPARRAHQDHRVDGPALPGHPDPLRRQPPDRRHLRSAEHHDSGRAAVAARATRSRS